MKKHVQLTFCRLVLVVLLLLGCPGFATARTNESSAVTLSRLPRTNLLVYHNRSGEVAPVKSKGDWQRRRNEILRGFTDIAGPLPGRAKRCALDVRVEETTDCGTYERQLISYASEPGSRVPAYLLVPKVGQASRLTGQERPNALANSTRSSSVFSKSNTQPPSGQTGRRPDFKFPAILCLHPTDMQHGHRVTVEKLRDNYRAYARDLAERGFVTLAPAYPLMANYQPDLKALGYESGTMKAVWDNIRGLDLLDSLPYVRHGTYGAIGHSLGGHNAIYTAVFDERIRVVVSSCGFDSFPDYYGGNPDNWQSQRGWCQTRYMLKLADYRGRLEEIPFDFHELVGALAPRPVFINAPLGDSNFQWRSVDDIVNAASAVYRLYRTPQNLRVVHPDCGHDFPDDARKLAYRLLEEKLR